MNLSMQPHKQMFNIYNDEISKFHDISVHEDYKGNSKSFILDNFTWKDKTVFEAGIGSGRFTDYYINNVKKVVATDTSENMINYCKNKFKPYNKKTNFINCSHSNIQNLKIGKFDTFISAYSLGCEIIDESKSVLETYNNIKNGIEKVTTPSSSIIILECETLFR